MRPKTTCIYVAKYNTPFLYQIKYCLKKIKKKLWLKYYIPMHDPILIKSLRKKTQNNCLWWQWNMCGVWMSGIWGQCVNFHEIIVYLVVTIRNHDLSLLMLTKKKDNLNSIRRYIIISFWWLLNEEKRHLSLLFV